MDCQTECNIKNKYELKTNKLQKLLSGYVEVASMSGSEHKMSHILKKMLRMASYKFLKKKKKMKRMLIV